VSPDSGTEEPVDAFGIAISSLPCFFSVLIEEEVFWPCASEFTFFSTRLFSDFDAFFSKSFFLALISASSIGIAFVIR